MKVERKDAAGYSYFSAMEDGAEIGEATYYSVSGGVITLTHVGIDPKYRGQGRAQELMMHVVEYARGNKLKIVPVCPFAKAMFEKYPDIRDVLAGV